MGFNCPYFLLQLAFLECFMSITSSLMTSFSLSLIFSLSFFNPHPSNRVSFSPLTSLRSSPISSVPVCASVVVHGRAFLFRFQFVRLFLLALAAGFDLSPFRKNVTEVVRSSPRPPCLGQS